MRRDALILGSLMNFPKADCRHVLQWVDKRPFCRIVIWPATLVKLPSESCHLNWH
jgi:hypothetical protein